MYSHFDDEGVGDGREDGLLALHVFHLFQSHHFADRQHLQREELSGAAMLREDDASEGARTYSADREPSSPGET